MKKITEKLVQIQTRLNAPKNLYNKFGGYKYRSCESIVEAAKPLLNELNCALVINDEIIHIGDRHYVKAVVNLKCAETGESETCIAFAREEETKKGMDKAQITGATSSYARKYALNGLFAIDDTKDPDATNDHKDSAPEPKKKAAPTKEEKKKATENAFTKHVDKIKEQLGNELFDSILNKMEVENYKTLTDVIKQRDLYQELTKALDAKKEKQCQLVV